MNMTEKKVTSNIKIENAKIIFKNFTGKKTDFNDEGNRNFGVLIDDDLAAMLIEDGWNVKYRPPRADDPDGHRQAWLPVKVKYGKIPPVVVLITSRGKMRLDEETICQLDWSSIESADMVIRPYNYPAMRGRAAGVSAYLKTMYVKIDEEEDELAAKYMEVQDIESDDINDKKRILYY